MGKFSDIVEGHVNELFNNYEDLFEDRMNICKKCPIYKETAFGPMCSSSLYIHVASGEKYSTIPKEGYKRGCGCRLNSKTRLVGSKCIINKW